MTETIISNEAGGGLVLPIDATQVASVSVIGTDLVVLSVSGDSYILPDVAFEALTDAAPAVVFADGTSRSSTELVKGALGLVTIDTSIRAPSLMIKAEEEEADEDEEDQKDEDEAQDENPEQAEEVEPETTAGFGKSRTVITLSPGQ